MGRGGAVSGDMPIRRRLGALALIACAGLPWPAAAAAAPAPPVPFEQISAALNGVHQFSQVALVAGRAAVRVRRDGQRPQLRFGLPTSRGPTAAHSITACVGRTLRRERRRVVARRPPAGVRHHRPARAAADRGRGLHHRGAGPRGDAGEGSALDAALVAGRHAARVPVLARRAQDAQPAQPAHARRRRRRREDLRAAPRGDRRPRLRQGGPRPSGGAAARAAATSTCTSSIGRPTARASPPRPRTATATRTGGSPSSTRSTRRAAPRRASIIPICRSPRRAGRATANASRTSAGIMSDEAITGGDVFVVPANGGAATDVTPKLKASVVTIAWNGSPNRLLATELAGDRMVIASIDADRKRQQQLWNGQETIYATGFAGLAPGRRRRLDVARRQGRGDDSPVDHRSAGDRDRHARRAARRHGGERAHAAAHRRGAQPHLDQRRRDRARLADLSARRAARRDVPARSPTCTAARRSRTIRCFPAAR